MKRPPLTPGQKATIVFCGLVLMTGITAVAFLGAMAAVPAIAGSFLAAGPITCFAYVVFLRSEDAEKE